MGGKGVGSHIEDVQMPITYCIRNEEIITQQAVMQQGGNDTLEASIAPVRLQCTHTDEQRLMAGPKPQNPGIK